MLTHTSPEVDRKLESNSFFSCTRLAWDLLEPPRLHPHCRLADSRPREQEAILRLGRYVADRPGKETP